MDLSLKKPTKEKKFSSLHFQSRILLLMGEMLQNGFSFQEILQFISKLPGKEGVFGRLFLQEMAKGKEITEAFSLFPFSKDTLLQIELSFLHGNLAFALCKLANHLQVKNDQKKALQKVMTYPSFLLGFILFLMMSLKFFILPHFKTFDSLQGQKMFTFLYYFPDFLFVFFLVVVVSIVFIKYRLRKKTAYDQVRFLIQFPLFGSLYRYYLTALVSSELGKMFQLGIDLKTSYLILSQQVKHPFMKEFAQKGQRSAEKGISFIDSLKSAPFFKPELSLIIQSGEKKGNLGEELLHFSDYLWKEWQEKIEQTLRYVQPIVFLVVALFIVLLYATLLLPIYNQSLLS